MTTLHLAAFSKKVADLIGGAAVTTATILETTATTATIDHGTALAILKARAAEAAAKTAKESLEADLKAQVGDATEILVDGKTLFTFKPQSKVVLDGARFKEDHPDIWARYSREQHSRPLLVKPKIAALLFG